MNFKGKEKELSNSTWREIKMRY